MKELIIDETNQFLVRQKFEGYRYFLYTSVPRKTPKGYLGHKKGEYIEGKIYDRNKAERMFHEWKEEYLPKLLRKEIIVLRFGFYPIYYYNVTCPYCKQDADVMDFIMIMGTDIYPCCPIQCRFCEGVNPDDCLTWRDIGECRYLEKNNEETEMRFSKRYQNSGIKYSDFIENPNILDEKMEKG